MSETTLRTWTYEDILEVAALEKLCFSDPWGYKAFADSFLGGRFRGTVAVEDGKIVGYGMIEGVCETADLERIAVCPSRRRRGLGARILRSLIAAAAELGAERLLLEVRPSNAAALALYEAEGFRKIASRAHYYGDGEEAIVMEKRIEEGEKGGE